MAGATRLLPPPRRPRRPATTAPTPNDRPAAPEAGPALHPVAPHPVCAGPAQALDFPARAFGAEEVMRRPGPDGRLAHARARVDGSTLMDEAPERHRCKDRGPGSCALASLRRLV